MEDLGTIIWVLIIIGFAVSSGLSKYRKARGKGTTQPGEAWPSMGEEQEEAPAPPTPPGFPDIFGQPRRVPHAGRSSSKDPQTVEMQENTPESETVPASSRKAATASAFPRERGFEAGFQPAGASGPTSARTTAQRSPKATESPKNEGTAREPGQQGENAILNEEFDLRRAVIYSEILKPKFEE